MTDKNKENKFRTEWEKLTSNGHPPIHFSELVEISFDELKYQAVKQEPAFVKKFTENIWNGDCYLLKNAFSKEWIQEAKNKVFEQG